MSLDYWQKQLEEFKDAQDTETSRLAYLDLSSTPKPKLSDLAHNLRILSFRTALGDKVNLAATHVAQKQVLATAQEQHEEVKRQLKALKKDLQQHSQVAASQQQEILKQVSQIKARLGGIHPLTKEDVRDLVLQLIEQPKAIERQTEELTLQLSSKVDRVEKLIRELEDKLTGL